MTEPRKSDRHINTEGGNYHEDNRPIVNNASNIIENLVQNISIFLVFDIETLEMARICRKAAPKKEQKVAQLTEVISQAVVNGDKPGRNSVAKQLQWSAGQVSKLAGYLGEKIGISTGWGELIEAVTSVLKNLNTKVTSKQNLTPVELRTVEVFFPTLLDDLRRDAISTETAAKQIYLTLRQFAPEVERVLGGVSERSLWEVINLFAHLRRNWVC